MRPRYLILAAALALLVVGFPAWIAKPWENKEPRTLEVTTRPAELVVSEAYINASTTVLAAKYGLTTKQKLELRRLATTWARKDCTTKEYIAAVTAVDERVREVFVTFMHSMLILAVTGEGEKDRVLKGAESYPAPI